jgi:hypothetical protein
MTKLLISYLLLVGVPILGVFGLLRIGANLAAPVAVAGEWVLTEAPSSVCMSGLVWDQPPRMAIAQSGRLLVVSLSDANHSVLTGKLEGLALTATESDRGLWLSAAVDKSADPYQMQVELTLSDCPEPVQWSATRFPVAQNQPASH